MVRLSLLRPGSAGRTHQNKIARSRSRDRHDRRAVLACSGRIRPISGCLWRCRWSGEPKCTKRHRGSEFCRELRGRTVCFCCGCGSWCHDRRPSLWHFCAGVVPLLALATPIATPLLINQLPWGLLQKTQTRKMPDLAVVARTPFWSFCAGQRQDRPRADHGRNIETTPECRVCLFPTTVPTAV